MTDTSSEISLLPQVAEAALEADPVQELEQQPVLTPVVRAIQRLEDVIDTETRLLLEGGHPDLAEINSRKSRGLYDFNKAIKKAASLAEPATMKGLQPLLDSLKQKLEKIAKRCSCICALLASWPILFAVRLKRRMPMALTACRARGSVTQDDPHNRNWPLDLCSRFGLAVFAVRQNDGSSGEVKAEAGGSAGSIT